MNMASDTSDLEEEISWLHVDSFSPIGNSTKSSELSYTSLGNGKLQPCTSSWQTVDLEAVGVFYNTNSLPISTLLDLIYEQSGTFGALTTPQKEFVEGLQTNITFSSSMFDLTRGDCYGKVENFIVNTMLMTRCAMDRQIPETLTEAVFVDVFKSFARMCGLFPVCGSEWRTKINILKCRVSSEADVILMNADYLKNRTSIMSIVSIVEVKNKLGECVQSQRTRPKRKTSNDSSSNSVTQEEPVNEEPEIFKRIEHAVLAQHGGELFVNAHGNMQCSFLNRSKNSRLIPGMIVIGTEVTITVLDYKLNHEIEIHKSNKSITERSCIYYSDTKDLLKKEDRDMVLEALVRMNNRCTP